MASITIQNNPNQIGTYNTSGTSTGINITQPNVLISGAIITDGGTHNTTTKFLNITINGTQYVLQLLLP
jgi:hypothetical protein